MSSTGTTTCPGRCASTAATTCRRVSLATGEPAVHTDLPRLRAGGVTGQFWSVFVPCSLTGADAVRATHEQVDFVHALVEDLPGDLALCRTADDVDAAVAGGSIASLMGMEGGHSIDSSLDVLRSCTAGACAT